MTELMKRYEAETGERATFVYIEKDSEGREKSTNITTGGFDVWVMGEAERLNEENAKLKDQLRWRPVSEKPERCGEYLCTWDFSDSVVMYYDDSGWSVWDASWDDYIDTANPPKYWLPIPLAPEGGRMRSYNQKGFALLNVEKCNSCGNHPMPLSNGKTEIDRRYTICCISCNKMVGWHNTVDEAVDAWESDQKEYV